VVDKIATAKEVVDKAVDDSGKDNINKHPLPEWSFAILS
jgi:hypothetical protein